MLNTTFSSPLPSSFKYEPCAVNWLFLLLRHLEQVWWFVNNVPVWLLICALRALRATELRELLQFLWGDTCPGRQFPGIPSAAWKELGFQVTSSTRT